MADEAAEFGRRRVGENVLDARREFSRACRIWYPIIRDLHRFFIAIARVIVNDLVLWPFSPGALVKLAAFLSSLSWPCEVTDLGPGGVSYLELLILCERWAGERLRIEDAISKFRRLGRQISVSAAPLCPDIDIWKLCRYFGRMMRALCHLPGGLGRFIPGRIGTNHSRLRHIGWEKCCHGLTCRPLETSGEGFLGDLLSLIGYPSGSGAALLGGTLKLKYHTVPFACRKPTWKLPSGGGVTHILTTGGEDIRLRWGISGEGGGAFPL